MSAEEKKTAAPKPAAVKTEEDARKTLTLEQKFVELRKAVPAITQKQHSEGVRYKFAKIFDVYQLLAPAMNDWGVNFDVVAEAPTNHRENGDPVYYSSYQQQTRAGARTVWIYEADITIRWTNADRPEERQEITLHALGTNDGGPDKAKGSAWTYALKYYLFEKFNIDQGEDDPDNYDRGYDAAASPQRGRAAPQTNARPQRESTRPQPKTPHTASPEAQAPVPERLSDEQTARLYKLAAAVGLSKEETFARIGRGYNVSDPRELTGQQYEKICGALEKAAAARKEQPC